MLWVLPHKGTEGQVRVVMRHVHTNKDRTIYSQTRSRMQGHIRKRGNEWQVGKNQLVICPLPPHDWHWLPRPQAAKHDGTTRGAKKAPWTVTVPPHLRDASWLERLRLRVLSPVWLPQSHLIIGCSMKPSASRQPLIYHLISHGTVLLIWYLDINSQG